jgi:prolyl oligopeptidase
LVDGYGGYGLPENAYFNRRMHAWFERGGLFVEVKPRGGGAYGRDWYQSGVGARKSNTWKDMIACAETLIARGYTSRGKIAVHGTSMGGVAAGRAVTERPDLFAVAIIRVGITEAVRFIEATTNGPNHESEMGSVKTEAGVRQLLAMSTYHQIKDGTPYPAVLFTAGMNDNRVAPWIAFKTFARLSAATSSARPVLLRVESAAGHGMSSTAEQRNSEMADRLAFILWNTGDKAFQPEP